jgi:hypothetical protein
MREWIWTSRLSASWPKETPSAAILSLAALRDEIFSGVDDGFLDSAKIWVERDLRDERAASRDKMALTRDEERELMFSTLKEKTSVRKDGGGGMGGSEELFWERGDDASLTTL